MRSTELYLTVLPLIHIGINQYGLTEQTLTLFPDKNFATEFLPEEVESYILVFKRRADKYLVGGRVISYDVHQEPTGEGRVIVRVTQNVT